MKKWINIDGNFDRSVGFKKVRIDTNAPTDSSFQDGYFSELPNINCDGMSYREPSGPYYGYASENRFNPRQKLYSVNQLGFTDGHMENDWTDIGDGFLEYEYPVTMYWGGYYGGQSSYEIMGNTMFAEIDIQGLDIDITSISASKHGGDYEVNLTSDLQNWTASTDADFITLSQYSGGTGETAVSITIKGTNVGVERIGSITFTDGTNESILSITQQKGLFELKRNGSTVYKAYKNGKIIYNSFKSVSQS